MTFAVNSRTEHIQIRVYASGLWSAWATVRVVVSFTPPSAPTLSLTTSELTASITATIDNPATGVAVVSNDLYVREVERPGTTVILVATGVELDGSYTWYPVHPGLWHRLRVSGRGNSGEFLIDVVRVDRCFHTRTAASCVPL